MAIVINQPQEDTLMSEKMTLKPITVALGTTFAISLAASPVVNAAENPFSATAYESGYMVAEGKCGEGKCGEGKDAEGKCGEGKEAEGKCGEGKDAEGKCGEGKEAEGKCGEGKCGEGKEAEGKCGEGKCGS
jgi:uncharacterized low-complexity protein